MYSACDRVRDTVTGFVRLDWSEVDLNARLDVFRVICVLSNRIVLYVLLAVSC